VMADIPRALSHYGVCLLTRTLARYAALG
jgi:hypothetical protein